MANKEHLDILKQGVKIWNEWRDNYADIRPDLSNANLRGADLSYANLGNAKLSGADLGDAELFKGYLYKVDLTNANLSRAELVQADLIHANLSRANLSHVNLDRADLTDADLSEADLSEAALGLTNFQIAILSHANFTRTRAAYTVFGNVDLSSVKGLETVEHTGPSIIGIDTIYLSKGNIPEVFLKGAGVNETFITYFRSLVGKPIDYYSCFISYSSKDESFARRLYADLQGHNVRCWYAPEDLKIGDKFRHRIDESIRIYDKLLIVLSEASIASTWVGYEVEKALDKEPEGKHNVLFPIRLDKAILDCETDWAKDIRKSRHIGDFERWKDHDAYQVAFERLLRDLKAQS